MAFYITIKKISETNDAVIYEYVDEQTGKGHLQLAKESGDVVEIMPAPGDSSGRRFQRAAMKVVQHWKIGEFPEETKWASQFAGRNSASITLLRQKMQFINEAPLLQHFQCEGNKVHNSEKLISWLKHLDVEYLDDSTCEALAKLNINNIADQAKIINLAMQDEVSNLNEISRASMIKIIDEISSYPQGAVRKIIDRTSMPFGEPLLDHET